MKYQIVINQVGIVAAGLHTETDLVDWAILNHIYGWQANSRAERLENGKVWISYQNIIDELPVIGLNIKSAISNRIKKLRDLGLLETEQTEDKRLFVKVSRRYERVAEYRVGVHENEQGVHENEQGVHGSEQGGVHENEHTSRTISNPKQDPKKDMVASLPFSVDQDKPKSRFDDFYSAYPKKVKRKPAEGIWKRKKLDRIADLILRDIQNRRLNDDRWKNGYIPDTTTYLNQERWNDDIQSPANKPSNKKFSIFDELTGERQDNPRQVYKLEDGVDLLTKVDDKHPKY